MLEIFKLPIWGKSHHCGRLQYVCWWGIIVCRRCTAQGQLQYFSLSRTHLSVEMDLSQHQPTSVTLLLSLSARASYLYYLSWDSAFYIYLIFFYVNYTTEIEIKQLPLQWYGFACSLYCRWGRHEEFQRIWQQNYAKELYGNVQHTRLVSENMFYVVPRKRR